MNTTMADGAHDRLVAQIGEALFDQPGMILTELANRLRLARGGGGPLMCASCYGFGVIGGPSYSAPDEGGEPCMDCAPLQLDRYDAGLLGDGGGGEVAWWQDYIRSELDRAHDFYQDQVDAHG